MPPQDEHRVEIHLDRLLAERGMSLTELAARVGLTLANLSVLKNGHARALQCTPGELITVRPAHARR
jgi:putative transcriptional regulator